MGGYEMGIITQKLVALLLEKVSLVPIAIRMVEIYNFVYY